MAYNDLACYSTGYFRQFNITKDYDYEKKYYFYRLINDACHIGFGLLQEGS